jgi:CBS domain-containing protein
VEDVMTSDPQTARRSTPVLDVVRTMMDQKIGSVLVVDDNRDILGLFTTADALRVLEDLLDGDSGDGYYRFYLDDYVNQGWRTSLA